MVTRLIARSEEAPGKSFAICGQAEKSATRSTPAASRSVSRNQLKACRQRCRFSGVMRLQDTSLHRTRAQSVKPKPNNQSANNP